ncbi:membrane protein insertion efficiency factor YidD [Lentibacillus halodurans]|nr:membrane protein insertion efficiency factor YidD [Lentibacillus halodurans]
MKYLLIGLIKFYRRTISPFKPPTCRFFPTCSEYGLEAIRRFGFFKGGFLTLRRISKCHPFHSGGVDLVPEKRQNNRIHPRSD